MRRGERGLARPPMTFDSDVIAGYATPPDYTTSAPAPAETAVETRGQIAAQNGVAEAVLDRANPGITARAGWGSLAAGTSILIPRR
jgi:hypothetical protein